MANGPLRRLLRAVVLAPALAACAFLVAPAARSVTLELAPFTQEQWSYDPQRLPIYLRTWNSTRLEVAPTSQAGQRATLLYDVRGIAPTDILSLTLTGYQVQPSIGEVVLVRIEALSLFDSSPGGSLNPWVHTNFGSHGAPCSSGSCPTTVGIDYEYDYDFRAPGIAHAPWSAATPAAWMRSRTTPGQGCSRAEWCRRRGGHLSAIRLG